MMKTNKKIIETIVNEIVDNYQESNGSKTIKETISIVQKKYSKEMDLVEEELAIILKFK